jgi:hypothetical protein
MDRRMAITDAIRLRTRVLAAGIAVLAAGLAMPAINADAQESPAAITCTNPVSGTSWQIIIDYRKSTVDANAATITPAGISWFDPTDGGNYTLDRKSGDLTAGVASSTGGYFRRAHCALPTPR